MELQQRAVEFASLFSLGELRVGVLERMPPPELKATVTGVGTCSPDIPILIDNRAFHRPVSENKPVGSTRTGKDVRGHLIIILLPNPRYPFVKVDLLGDDVSTPSDPVVAVPGGHKTNEDLLAEIFGGSTATSATTNAATPTSASSQPQKTTAADILGLFDSPAPSVSPQAPQAPPTVATSLFDLGTAVTPTTPAPKPAAPNLPSYTAYNKNDLVISLTPQSSTMQPGVVDILARFQVKGSTTATNLNFQVAVPKVKAK